MIEHNTKLKQIEPLVSPTDGKYTTDVHSGRALGCYYKQAYDIITTETQRI